MTKELKFIRIIYRKWECGTVDEWTTSSQENMIGFLTSPLNDCLSILSITYHYKNDT